MISPKPLLHLISRLWHHLSQRRRRQLGLLVILMILASFAEVVSIGAVLPFLGVLTAPERVFAHQMAQPVIQVLGIARPDHLLVPLTIAFGIAALVAGAMRMMLLYVSTRLAFATGSDISNNIYRRTLYQPYAVHAARNSSEVIDGIVIKTQSIIFQVLMPILTIASSILMLIAILVVLLTLDPMVAMAAFIGLGMLYGIITSIIRKRLTTNSRRIAQHSTQIIKSLQEGLGGIRDVLIDGSQDTYCQIHRNADLPLRRAQGNNQFISESPRYALEALGMVLIAGLAYVLSQQSGGIDKAIPILGALALGAIRLLPVMQQSYRAFANIKGSQASLQDVVALLEQPLPAHSKQVMPPAIPFKESIEIENLSFRYAADAPWVLRDITLTLPKGGRIGFIGSTGSGKSTLLDIIMGLLEPTEGSLVIDEVSITPSNQRSWHAHIAHVPQNIFLADRTIEENIAFGLPKDQIDHERVRQAASQAQIHDLIESWPDKYQASVGERGIRLSGGQRQRIGIARALYKVADVIIFDEATSALDNETERAVMEAIEGLSQNLTVLIIAHRLSTLRNCDQIIELGDGGVRRVGSYQDLIESSSAPK